MRHDPVRFRYASEGTGLIVLLALVLFVAAIMQAGVLHDLFRPSVVLRVILPDEGVGGLSRGAAVEILGTKAGEVTRIVIDPKQQMHAEVRLEENMQVYVRRDSQAVIRKRYGVAGDSYLDISRGAGEPLDWTYAVIAASLDRPPTENLGAVVDEMRQKILPIIDDTHRSVQLLASIVGRIEQGEGAVGRLLTDDRLVRDLEATVASAKDSVQATGALIAQLSDGPGSVPDLLRRVDKSLADMQRISRDVARTTAQLPQIARNVDETSASLPMVLLQSRATAAELQQLVVQLRGNWLLGGGPEATATRLPATAVRP
jgi:phospholipid/cholesterol/gamma-HCH transport system substrate-binding protein